MSSIEEQIHEVQRKVAELESRKPVPGPQGERGRPGDISAAEHLIGSRISRASEILKSASDQAIAKTAELDAAFEKAKAGIEAVAQKVADSLEALNAKLRDPEGLQLDIIRCLEEYQIIRDGDVGPLLQYHIAKHASTLTPEDAEAFRASSKAVAEIQATLS